MLRNRPRLLLIICIFVVLSTAQIFAAKDERALNIYNTRQITNDKEATFIEGETPSSNGQTIVVKAGLHAIAEKKMPDTGMPAKFKIKIPAENIFDDKASILFVEEKGEKRNSRKSVRVELEYVERQVQEITTDSTEYKMTYPGYDASIKATATSGDKIIFTSSNPEVAEVDEKGNLVARGGGNTTITVKQIGNSEYNGTEKKIGVSVKAIDAYTVTFHSSIDDKEEETSLQIIESAKTERLQENTFENGDHKFLGWATEDGGLVIYDDNESVQDIVKTGENADLYAVWTGDGAVAAVKWAIDIANDDSFAYGKKPAANAIGCYFCGTNCGPVKYNKPKGYEKTYVCLTFVAAAYAHGAEDPEIYYACSHGKMPLYENDNNFSKFSCWTKVGKCSNLSINDLKPGDVVISWSDHNDNSGHTWMYAGNDQIVESTGGGWGAGSIALKGGASKRLSIYGRSGKNYVMRYTGVNARN